MHTPILLITFNRPEHTRRVLEALQQNYLAAESDLFVYVDGPKTTFTPEQVAQVEAVKEVVRSQQWCKTVTLRASETNRGCRDAIIFAISEMLRDYEDVIIIEDDIITSPAFLTYMNKALAYYKNRKTVFSISGHSHSPQRFQVPADYLYDVFASPRLFNWGWATWRDRWEQANWTMDYYDAFMKCPYEQQAFMRGGDDMLPMLTEEREGRSSAWDIQFAFAHFANHAVSIVPCVSYTENIGLDGSGTHCQAVAVENVPVALNQKIDVVFLDNLYFDSRIINSLYSIFTRKKRPLWQKVCNFVVRKLGKRPPFVIKKKVYAD